MAIRVELSKEAFKACINQRLASLRRSINTESNPLIKEILQKDLTELIKADNSITDIK